MANISFDEFMGYYFGRDVKALLITLARKTQSWQIAKKIMSPAFDFVEIQDGNKLFRFTRKRVDGRLHGCFIEERVHATGNVVLCIGRYDSYNSSGWVAKCTESGTLAEEADLIFASYSKTHRSAQSFYLLFRTNIRRYTT